MSEIINSLKLNRALVSGLLTPESAYKFKMQEFINFQKQKTKTTLNTCWTITQGERKL